MNGARREKRVDDREAPPQASRENATKRLPFTHAELLRAVVEHRREARDEVKSPLFDFRKEGDELRRELAV